MKGGRGARFGRRETAWLVWALLAACPARAQFGPNQTKFRDKVTGWIGTLDVHGVASGTFTGPAGGTATYTTDQHITTDNLVLYQFDPNIAAWTGNMLGTITVKETSVVTLAGCTITSTLTASTAADKDFRGVPLTFYLSLDIGSDTWSIGPSSNSVNGTDTAVTECAGVSQTSTSTVAMRFMPINQTLRFPFPASGYALVGTGTAACDGCGNANSNLVNYTYTYNLQPVSDLQTTVTTNPAGLAMVVDGATQNSPQTYHWDSGSAHTIGVSSPQGGATRNTYLNWSDGGAQTHTITVGNASATYTANFATRYLLSTAVNPAAGGSITADPVSLDGYYIPGTPVQLTLTPNCGYQFTSWSGDVSGNTNPQTVVMTAPRSVTANMSASGATCTSQKAVMTGPPPSSTLSGSSVTFSWSGTGASGYWLNVGTVPGGSNIFSANMGLATSQLVTSLPGNGSTIWVRIWSLLGGVWQYSDANYTGAGVNTLAVITSPAPGSVLTGTTATFVWNPGTGAADYFLDVGTRPFTNDIYSRDAGLATSATVAGLPADGSQVYVRLWTLAANVWQYNDYAYTASGGTSKAVMQFPPPGAVLSGNSVVFTWSAGTGATAYWMDVGSTAGGYDIFSQGAALATSQSVSGLPTDSSTVYVRLWTAFGGTWRFNDYTYIASSGRAVISSPVPGSGLSGTAVTFTWNSVSGATQYWLDIGTTPQGYDIFSQSAGLATSQAVSGLPTSGATIYVRLWTALGGTWQSSDCTFQAAGSVPAVMTAPAPSSTLTGSTVTFAWSTSAGATQYWLDIGTMAGGYDIFSQSAGTATSQTVSGLPTNGSNVYVRLWTALNATWQFHDYVYRAAQ